MSQVTVTYDTSASGNRLKRGWSLEASATDAILTNGAENDPNIFVMNTSIRVGGDAEVFSHVADTFDMANMPDSKDDVPPKEQGYYRSSILKLHFKSKVELDKAILSINYDVKLLVDMGGASESQETYIIVSA